MTNQELFKHQISYMIGYINSWNAVCSPECPCKGQEGCLTVTHEQYKLWEKMDGVTYIKK